MNRALIPLLNETTKMFFVSTPLFPPSEVEFDSDDIFDRGVYQTSDLAVGVSLPLETLCKLPCAYWTAQDSIDLSKLSLKRITFLAQNHATGMTQVLTTGDLFGASGTKAVRPDPKVDKVIIDFCVKHFSTRLLKAVVDEPVTVFGDNEGHHAHFSLQMEYKPYPDVLDSIGQVQKCSHPDVELKIIGFALSAEHEHANLAA